MKSIKEIKLNKQSMDSTFLGQAAYTWKMLWVHLDWTYYCWNWKLKTENWKYYSKIIFKCVNSTMGPILNFFSAVNSDEQWFFPLHNEPMWGYYSRTGKKKIWKRRRPSQTHTLYASFTETQFQNSFTFIPIHISCLTYSFDSLFKTK